MSEVQSRGQSSRGRGSFRGGRGGYRGTRGGAKAHGRSEEQDTTTSPEEQGELGELKMKYGDKLPLMREVCQGWSDEDLIYALQDADGDAELALDKITTGAQPQWGEVKKKGTKAKDATVVSDSNTRGRGRGSLEGRGRGRGSERGARAGRGGRAVSQTNGTKSAEKPIKTTEEAFGDAAATTTSVSESKPTNGDTEAANEWANEPGKDQLASLATEEPKPASAAAPSKSGGWAGLFAKPTPAPAPTPVAAPATKKAPTPPPAPIPAPEEPAPVPAVDEIPTEPTPPAAEPTPIAEVKADLHSETLPEMLTELSQPHDELTEKNLDKLPDISHPPTTMTAVSTTASTPDPMNPAIPITPAIRPGMSGFAASALKATTAAGRSASYSRKLMEQQEAVVMPGNHGIDRTAVQFGKMGLGAGDDIDADEDREEPETRTQLPDDSPAAPRASLPPAVPESKPLVEAVTKEAPVTRPAPGLPPAPQQAQPSSSPPQSSSYTDQYRYGQGQKAYDPFTQQPQTQAANSEPFSNQVPGQSQHNLPGSGQDYSHYYSGNREAYNQYYGGYGQGPENQRTNSAFGTSAQDTQAQYATARPGQTYSQSELQNSGNNTPNPTAATHQAQPSQPAPSQGSYGGPQYGYPNAYNQQYPQYGGTYMAGNMSHRYGANRPMFDDVRRDNDYYGGGGGNQYGYAHNQQYSNSYKSNMYAQPQHQYSHDYSSSPANAAGFGGREASYGRAGSTQPSEGQQSASAGNNAFSGMPDPFGRTSSGFGQTSGHGEEQSKASGPSPSLQGGRPGSALNNMGGQQGLPHPQSQHATQGFGGYQQQYGGFSNQSHQNSGYSNYGSNAAFGGYGYGGGRGWSGYSGQH